MSQIDWYRFRYFIFAPDGPIDAIVRIMAELGGAIKWWGDRIQEAQGKENDEYLELLYDLENAEVENLLGTAFVLCQTYITFVVSSVKRLHSSCEEQKIKLSTTDGSKDAILRLRSKMIPETSYTQVQIMDAFANYFKHRDEWVGSWDKFKGKSKKTATIIQSIGACRSSIENMHKAASALTNGDFANLMIFVDILREWGVAVHTQYDAELESLDLLK